MENSYLIPLGLPADITLNVMGMNFKKKILCVHFSV